MPALVNDASRGIQHNDIFRQVLDRGVEDTARLTEAELEALHPARLGGWRGSGLGASDGLSDLKKPDTMVEVAKWSECALKPRKSYHVRPLTAPI